MTSVLVLLSILASQLAAMLPEHGNWKYQNGTQNMTMLSKTGQNLHLFLHFGPQQPIWAHSVRITKRKTTNLNPFEEKFGRKGNSTVSKIVCHWRTMSGYWYVLQSWKWTFRWLIRSARTRKHSWQNKTHNEYYQGNNIAKFGAKEDRSTNLPQYVDRHSPEENVTSGCLPLRASKRVL